MVGWNLGRALSGEKRSREKEEKKREETEERERKHEQTVDD